MAPEIGHMFEQDFGKRACSRKTVSLFFGRRFDRYLLIPARDAAGRGYFRQGFVQMLEGDGHRAISCKRPFPRNQLIRDDPERVDITALIERFTAYLLGRHVVGGPDNLPRPSYTGVQTQDARRSEISQLYFAAAAD